MRVGMMLPSAHAPMDRVAFLAWCRTLEDGPFDLLAMGERIAYDNHEPLTSLAAAATITESLELLTDVAVLPAHNEALFAKQAATIDVLSGGRLTLGVGVGGRAQDYAAVGADDSRPHARMYEQIEAMRRIWAGEPTAGGPVGPAPVQTSGPPLLAGVLGPRSIAHAPDWAAGIAGFDLGPTIENVDSVFRNVEAAWAAAARQERPRLTTAFFFGLGADGADQVRRHVTEYLSIQGEEFARAAAQMSRVSDTETLVGALRDLRDIGADDVVLCPTTADPDEALRAADAVSRI